MNNELIDLYLLSGPIGAAQKTVIGHISKTEDGEISLSFETPDYATQLQEIITSMMIEPLLLRGGGKEENVETGEARFVSSAKQVQRADPAYLQALAETISLNGTKIDGKRLYAVCRKR